MTTMMKRRELLAAIFALGLALPAGAVSARDWRDEAEPDEDEREDEEDEEEDEPDEEEPDEDEPDENERDES